MKRLIQTRTHEQGSGDNCFATAIACLMDLEDPEEVWQLQEHYPEDGDIADARWVLALDHWLGERGYTWLVTNDHVMDGGFYLVSGKTNRHPTQLHVCIYQNGLLYHDPHPTGGGLITEEHFELVRKLPVVLQ